MASNPGFKTVQARTTHDTMVKPGELIDVVEMTPLTLSDRRIFNLLIANAWDRIAEPIQHAIRKAEIRGSHTGRDRIGESIERLMGAIVRVKVRRGDKEQLLRVQLLAPNLEDKAPDGMFRYAFSEEMRAIILHSESFGRLSRDVMFALSSKYALALYEMVQKRANLDYVFSEEFSVDELRHLLGVPNGKLKGFKNFNTWALKPAMEEVNALGDYGVKVVPVKTGQVVVSLKLTWWKKNLEELKAAFAELRRHKAGRRARMSGTVETVDALPAIGNG